MRAADWLDALKVVGLCTLIGSALGVLAADWRWNRKKRHEDDATR